jgi:hypothetical protein
MAIWPIRTFLYGWLFATSVVLLGLTGYRIHYTKGLNNGDILTSSSHFYDGVIAELLVTSALAILISLWFLTVLMGRVRARGLGSYASEHIQLFIIWIMFLVGAAVTTHRWSNLKWCRGSQKVCRILETIKAFSWMCWIFTTFLILASLANMMMHKVGLGGAAHGRSEDTGRYAPETRQTTTTTTTHSRPAAAAVDEHHTA